MVRRKKKDRDKISIKCKPQPHLKKATDKTRDTKTNSASSKTKQVLEAINTAINSDYENRRDNRFNSDYYKLTYIDTKKLINNNSSLDSTHSFKQSPPVTTSSYNSALDLSITKNLFNYPTTTTTTTYTTTTTITENVMIHSTPNASPRPITSILQQTFQNLEYPRLTEDSDSDTSNKSNKIHCSPQNSNPKKRRRRLITKQVQQDLDKIEVDNEQNHSEEGTPRPSISPHSIKTNSSNPPSQTNSADNNRMNTTPNKTPTPSPQQQNIYSPTQNPTPSPQPQQTSIPTPSQPQNTSINTLPHNSNSNTTRPPPPIHIYTSNHKGTVQEINSQVNPQPGFKYNNNSLICYPSGPREHHKILTILNKNKIEYYSYDVDTLRPVKVIVKYIPIDTTTDDIRNDLNLKNLPFVNIARLMVPKDGRRVPSNLLILTIPRHATDAYYKLTNLCHYRVTVTEYIRQDIPQCHRCQYFGHSSAVCNRIARCVRCGDNHEGAPCAADTCKCANCGAAHPSNYRGCPAYNAARDRLLPRQNNRQNNDLPTPGQRTNNTNTNTNRQQLVQPSTATINMPPLTQETADIISTQNVQAWQRFRQKDRQTNQPRQTQFNTPDDSNENPIRDIINCLKNYNIKKIWDTLKKLIQDLKNTKDPLEKIFIILENIISLF